MKTNEEKIHYLCHKLLINLTFDSTFIISRVICGIVWLSCMISPHLVQYVSWWNGSVIICVCLHSGHTVSTRGKLISFILSYFHYKVGLFRKCLVLFFRFRFVRFRLLFRYWDVVLVLLFVCLFWFCLFCLCVCSSIACFLFGVFLGVLGRHILRCSIFVCYGVFCMFFRSRHILLLGSLDRKSVV